MSDYQEKLRKIRRRRRRKRRSKPYKTFTVVLNLNDFKPKPPKPKPPWFRSRLLNKMPWRIRKAVGKVQDWFRGPGPPVYGTHATCEGMAPAKWNFEPYPISGSFAEQRWEGFKVNPESFRKAYGEATYQDYVKRLETDGS